MEDIYQRYGLSREEAVARGIRPIEYLKIETPLFVDEVTFLPSGLERYVESFELIWTLSIEATYAERRRWSDFLAFREFIQNSLDSEHEIYGYEGVQVVVEKSDLGTWIKDRGSGITYQAFILGGAEKPCHMRGAYGEGLKIGLLWFTTKHHPILILTHDLAFYCNYSQIADALVIIFGKSRTYVEGTHVLIYNYFIPDDLYKKVYYKLAGMSVKCKSYYSSPRCREDMPNLVMTPGDMLFVRDIFVNSFSKIIGTKAYYSYNLWWVDLEPNRVSVSSGYELYKKLGELLGKCPIIAEFIREQIQKREYGGIQYYILEDKYAETKAFYSSVENEVVDSVTALMNELGIDAYSFLGELDAVTAVAHDGGVCILIPEVMKPLFKGILRGSQFVAKKTLEMLEDSVLVDEKVLKAEERGVLRVYRLWTEYVSPSTTVKVIRGERSYYDDSADIIFLSKSVLNRYNSSTFIHELAHAYGVHKYRSAPDVSENFERALSEVAVIIYELTLFPERRAVIKRALHGGLFASLKSIDSFYGYLNFRIVQQETDFIYNFEEPAMFIVVGAGMASFIGIVAPVAPAEETYPLDLIIKADLIKDYFLKFKTGAVSIDEFRNKLTKAGLVHQRGVWLDNLIRRATEIEIYGYDLLNDEYKYLTTVRME